MDKGWYIAFEDVEIGAPPRTAASTTPSSPPPTVMLSTQRRDDSDHKDEAILQMLFKDTVLGPLSGDWSGKKNVGVRTAKKKCVQGCWRVIRNIQFYVDVSLRLDFGKKFSSAVHCIQTPFLWSQGGGLFSTRYDVTNRQGHSTHICEIAALRKMTDRSTYDKMDEVLEMSGPFMRNRSNSFVDDVVHMFVEKYLNALTESDFAAHVCNKCFVGSFPVPGKLVLSALVM